MGDYGRKLEFGASVEPLADPPDRAARVAVAADRAGLDLLGVQDHPYQRRFLDTWTLISTLAPQTERLRFFPDVASLPLRPPAMLAKAAASLDVISDGRVELGLGAGAFWDAIVAMDGPRRSPGEARRATEEAIQVMRLVWSGDRALRFEGEFYSLKGVNSGPRPPHEIGIWVGAYGPRMLDLIGRAADGWVPSLGYIQPDQLPEMQRRIDAAARDAGREPREVRRALNVSGRIGGSGNGPLEGPASGWIPELTRLALEVGMDTFVYWPREDHVRQVELFAAEVAPAVREAVEAGRGGSREVGGPRYT
jgi:alkanesulfonate monooxygenase SsuD/methylene tetrahydromethanopterin reductase-like flavin-dependent oxidoreductase (luciferase family)